VFTDFFTDFIQYLPLFLLTTLSIIFQITMIDVLLSVLLIASVIFLVYELRRFKVLHSKKYELPTEKIWEKFVGIRPEELDDANLKAKVQKLEGKIAEMNSRLDSQRRLVKKLIEELGS